MLLQRMSKPIVWLTLMIAATVTSALSAAEPLAVFSIKSIEELIDDVGHIGELVEQPQAADAVEGIIANFTGGKGLQGVDQTARIGAFVMMSDNGQPGMPVVFVPISDEKGFLELLGIFFPGANKAANGTVSLKAPNGQQFVGKFQNDYFFASQIAPALQDLPDPEKISNSEADIALELNFGKLPDPLKQLVLQQLDAAVALGAANRPTDPAERIGYDIGQNMTLNAFKSLITDGDNLSISFDIDSEDGLIAFDIGVSAKSGTAMSKTIAAYSEKSSAFADLLSAESLMTFTFATPVSQELQDGLVKGLELGSAEADKEIEGNADLKSDAEKKVATDVKNSLFTVLTDTIKTGRMDFAIAVGGTGENDMTMQLFTKIASGKTLNSTIEKAVAEARKSGEKADEIKLNVATAGSAKIHEVDKDKLSSEDKEDPFKGPAYITIGDDFLILSAGTDSLTTTKAAATKLSSGKTGARFGKAAMAKGRAPISLRMKLSNLLAFSGQLDEDTLAEAKEAFQDGGDEIALEITSTKSGIQLHFEIEDGVLQLGAALAGGKDK